MDLNFEGRRFIQNNGVMSGFTPNTFKLLCMLLQSRYGPRIQHENSRKTVCCTSKVQVQLIIILSTLCFVPLTKVA